MSFATPARLEYFYSFRSPYSYLSAPRVFALADRYDIELVWRGVRPMAMRGQPLPLAKQLYILRDAAREAGRLGMPFGPMYDPLGEGVWRCLSIAELAQTRGRLRRFVCRAGEAIWAEASDVADDAALRRMCESVGLPWQDCLAAMHDPALRDRIEANTARLAELGHWGVPTFSFDGELYWGQDRLEDLERALQHAKLHRSV